MTESAAPAVPSGFDAFGHKVPAYRLSAAYDAIREMIPDVATEDAMALVGRVARHIEDDRPYEALRVATEAPLPVAQSSPQGPHTPPPGVRLDVTGGYRLLATLCAGGPS